MKIISRFTLVLALLAIVCTLSSAEPNGSSELIVCGLDEVYILDVTRMDSPAKIWSWKAKDCPEIPKDIQQRFGTTDECKSVDGGSKILVTSSGGGVALVDRKSKKALFYAAVDYAHSAEILPGGTVAVAGSDEGDDKGNCLTLFKLRKSDKSVWNGRLYSGHGVVWDNMRQVLWALACDEIIVYKLRNTYADTPSLEKIAAYRMPEPGGHDLFAVPNSSDLSVTTYAHCWLFDRDTHKFQAHPDLPKTYSVKSIDINPTTGRLSYIQADPNEWWSHTIRFLHPNASIDREKEIIYKVRWIKK